MAAALEDTHGPREARGATVGGAQVHSVRLPSFVVSTEVVFGLPDERLSIRHDAGGSPTPYVAGTLLAARAAPGRVGLTRGSDTLLLWLAAERPGDHHLLHLVGALADGEDLGVAVEAADGVLLDVAVAAVDLHGLLARPSPRAGRS